jgi:Tfp pilus assembly major pilin PilA
MLVEIMIVVAIIGMLAVIAIPNFVRARTTAQQSACVNNLRLLRALTWPTSGPKCTRSHGQIRFLFGCTATAESHPRSWLPAESTWKYESAATAHGKTHGRIGHLLVGLYRVKCRRANQYGPARE